MSINQTHYGSGDNILHQHGNLPTLEYRLNSVNQVSEGYQYEYEIDITPPVKSFDLLIPSIGTQAQIASLKTDLVSSTLFRIPGNCSSVTIKFVSETEIVDDGNLFYLIK